MQTQNCIAMPSLLSSASIPRSISTSTFTSSSWMAGTSSTDMATLFSSPQQHHPTKRSSMRQLTLQLPLVDFSFEKASLTTQENGVVFLTHLPSPVSSHQNLDGSLPKKNQYSRSVERPQKTKAPPVSGFSVPAGLHIPAHDREHLERLCRYVAWPPFATKTTKSYSSSQNKDTTVRPMHS